MTNFNISSNTGMSREEFNTAFYGEDRGQKYAEMNCVRNRPILEDFEHELGRNSSRKDKERWGRFTFSRNSIDQPYGFTGRRHDREANQLMYFRARYFSNDLGRFISRDPIGYHDGMNLYRGYYVPLGVDPSGLACTIQFSCSLISSDEVDDDDCSTDCKYLCSETSRVDSAIGALGCDDIPTQLIVEDERLTDSECRFRDFCPLLDEGDAPTCPSSKIVTKIYGTGLTPPGCSRNELITACGFAYQAAQFLCDSNVCNIAATLAHDTCIAVANACANP